MFSIKNSYDYKNKYNRKLNTIPFTGEYESLDNYKFIYIYALSSKQDIISVQFANNKNGDEFEVKSDDIILDEDIEKEITIAHNWINRYSVKTKKISLNLYKSVKEEFWKCIFWMEKMDKYKYKLLEEIELIPNIGSKYLEVEEHFNMNKIL